MNFLKKAKRNLCVLSDISGNLQSSAKMQSANNKIILNTNPYRDIPKGCHYWGESVWGSLFQTSCTFWPGSSQKMSRKISQKMFQKISQRTTTNKKKLCVFIALYELVQPYSQDIFFQDFQKRFPRFPKCISETYIFWDDSYITLLCTSFTSAYTIYR